jgi:hypothetical protein
MRAFFIVTIAPSDCLARHFWGGKSHPPLKTAQLDWLAIEFILTFDPPNL